MLNNMKMKPRMLLSFSVIVVMSIILAITSIWELRVVADCTEHLYNRPLQVVDKTWAIREKLAVVQGDLLDAVTSPTLKGTQEKLQEADAETKLIFEQADILAGIFRGDDNETRTLLLEEFLRDFQSMNELTANIGKKTLAELGTGETGGGDQSASGADTVTAQNVADEPQQEESDAVSGASAEGEAESGEIESNNVQAAEISSNDAQEDGKSAMTVLREEWMPLYAQIRTIMIELSDSGKHNGEIFYLAAKKTEERSMAVVSILAVIQIVMAAAIALLLTRAIVRPLGQIKDAAKAMAIGNINIDVTYQSEDEIGNVADAFRDIAKVLKIVESDMETLGEWAIQGKIRERLETDTRLLGTYRKIIEDVDHILDTFVNHFDELPVAVQIVDGSGTCVFANKTVDVYKANIIPENIEEQRSAFTDDQGVAIGTMIVGIDQTSVKEAQRESDRQATAVAEQIKIAQKQSDFQDDYTRRFAEALKRMAKGDLDVHLEHPVYDQDTEHIHEVFKTLGDVLEMTASTIKGYIEELGEILGKISHKDLAAGIEREYVGDFTAIKDAINLICDSLNEVFHEIGAATDQVQSASSQMSGASQSLSQGAAEQASAVEQISATITQVAEQTKSNARNAEKASRISADAKMNAQEGSRHMDEMVAAMNAIKESSNGIANIIKVIEDIAFQTNILALNAAVEAARAGEHGKGFAVVAEEVRTLAARSATAARETTALIDNSLSRVESGAVIADETAGALAGIVDGIADTVDIVATIATASAQQASAIAQIDHGIEQISKVTQSNTAAATETAASSEELQSQALTLHHMVGEFHLKGQKSLSGGPSGYLGAPIY